MNLTNIELQIQQIENKIERLKLQLEHLRKLKELENKE